MITRATLVALSLLILSIVDAAAAEPARLREPAALDLANLAQLLADDGRIAGPDELADMVLRGDPIETGTPVDEGRPVWLVARLANDSPETRWAVLYHHAHIKRIDLWVYDRAILTAHAAAGIGVGTAEAQPEFARGYEFPVTLPTGEIRTLVMRLEPTLYLFGTPVLAPIQVAHANAALRRILFPLLLGTFLGMAALHGVVFIRFGGVANLLFIGTVVAIFLDWFAWLGGPHDLGLVTTVAETLRFSTVTWFTATFFIVVFCLNFFTFGRRARASYAALLGAFALFVAIHLATPTTTLQIVGVQAFLVISSGIILANALVAVRRRVSGARLALAAYGLALANELLSYASVSIPWLTAFGDWLKTSYGLFDVGTLLSQILVNGLFSLALWERVRAVTQEREAALRAERLKTVHVAQLSHDIRSPLHAVQSAIRALAAGTSVGIVDPRQVEVVQSSVRSVVAMLDDLVDAAKYGQVSSVRRAAVADIRQIVADAAAVARAALGDRPVTMRVEIADDVPELVRGDGVAIRRVLSNLLSNAVRATSRGNIRVAVSFHSSKPRIQVAVADTGCGMTDRRRQELFGLSAGSEGASTGLGLKVVRRLVDAMGGTLEASSRLGKGTTVRFEIPAPPVPAETHRPRPEGGAAVPHLRLLLVEDDKLAAAATAALLIIDGHEIKHASTVAEAVELARRFSFDLVLMDLGLDMGSGLEAIRAIRTMSDPIRSAVPIVVMTGDRDAAGKAHLAPLGIRSVLIKPFDVADLRRGIAESIGLGVPSDQPDPDGGSFLADLSAMLPPAGLRTLLETGRVQIRASMEALATASAEGRWQEARRSAHRLASSAGVLGFEHLVATARTAETAEDKTMAAAVSEAQTAADRALLELDRWLVLPPSRVSGPV